MNPIPEIENGLPGHLDSPLAWDKDSFRCEKDYTYYLIDAEVKEIDDALEHFKGLELDGHEANCSTFALPTLSHRLRALAYELHQGKGFVVLRGLDSSRYSAEDNMIIFLGLSSYIGEKRGKQDDRGNMIGHMQEAKYSKVAQRDRPSPNSNLALKFHTDMFADIVAMQTRSCAAQGGEHLVASAWNVYNEIATSRPDLIPVLASSDWGFDIRGRLAEPRIRPLLYYHRGHILLNFSRHPLEGSEEVCRAADLPRVSEQQKEALDLIERVAEEHSVSLQMEAGDLTFINNFAMVHSRKAFQDNEVHSRYLVRLWLKNSRLGWKLPRPLRLGNRMMFCGSDVMEKWNVLAVPKLHFPIHERLTP